MACERFMFEPLCALMVLGCILILVGKSFTKERKMITKQANFKERKKGSKIAPKRSAVISVSQKDSPFIPLHKNIRRSFHCTKRFAVIVVQRCRFFFLFFFFEKGEGS